MTPYNINVVKPEDDVLLYNDNALQLQAAGFTLGSHSGSSPCPEAHIDMSGQNGYTYPHISTSGFVNNQYPSRPQLTHLETAPSQYPVGMQSGRSSGLDEARRYYAQRSAAFTPRDSPMFQTSPALYGWTMANELADPNHQTNFVNGSPLSQGLSPLTPITPLSTVEPSPTVSSFPSPGSQGSEVLRLAPSPIHVSSNLANTPELTNTFNQLQLPGFYYHSHVSETQLSAPQTFAQTPPPAHQQYPEAIHSSSNLAVVTRRHSHSALDRPHTSPSFAPYPAPHPLPARSSSVRNGSFTQVPLVPRPQYVFEEWSLPGPVVPQTTYQPHTASDRKRYVEQFQLLPPIYFKRVGPPGIGITLVECVTHRFKQLQGDDDELFDGCGPSISVRLNWQGYESWSRQIPTKNFKVPAGQITRRHLAKNIAKTVQRFIDDHIGRPIIHGTDSRWQVGPGKIEFSDLILLSIHHVSRGSWQANLCLTQPLEHILTRSLDPQ